jgi:hypothetical protein
VSDAGRGDPSIYATEQPRLHHRRSSIALLSMQRRVEVVEINEFA